MMKLLTKFLLFVMVLVLIVGLIDMVVAVQPQQMYNKIFIDPLYREELYENTDYDYTLTVDTPDGISRVDNAMVTFQVWHNPSIRYYLWVNGETCNTETFYVSTSYANAGEGTIFFDCSNIITKEGDYIITLRTDDDTGTITGWIDLTYRNNPLADITVHGTEYEPQDAAKVWLQLLNSTGDIISNAVCYTDIYTPNGGKYIDSALMTNMNDGGIYYYNLNAPQIEGVYPATAECYYDAIQEYEYADGFELLWGKDEEQSYLKTYSLDGDEHKYKELNDDSGIRRLNFTYTFDDMCGLNVSEELLSGIGITHNQKWVSVTNDDITIHFYNFTSGVWTILPNKILSPNDRVTVSNSIITNNVTKDGLVNSTGSMILLFNDSNIVDGGDTKFEMDYLVVTCDQLANAEWQEVKGSSEIHVRSDTYYTSTRDSGTYTNESAFENFYIYYTISSRSSSFREEVEIELETFNAFPCEHINNVTVYNKTTSQWENVIFSKSLIYGKLGCAIKFDYDLEAENNYQVQLISENYWKRRILTDYADAILTNDVIEIACENYQEGNNMTNYTVPLTTTPAHADDHFYTSCQSYYEWFYYYEQHVQSNFFPILQAGNMNFTEDQMTSLESTYAHVLMSADRINNYGATIINGLNVGNSYSLAILSDPYPPVNPFYTLYFAQISSSYLTYVKLGLLPASTWTYENRSLTESVSVNTTEITSSVWNYSERELTDMQEIWIGGTEYSPDEEVGKVVIRLLGSNGDPIIGANCALSIMYPNNSRYLTNLQMIEIIEGEPPINATHSGIQYRDFNLSSVPGVYPYAIDCDHQTNDYFLLDTFHVFGANETRRIENIWNYSAKYTNGIVI